MAEQERYIAAAAGAAGDEARPAAGAAASETTTETAPEALRSPRKADSGEGHKEGHLPRKRTPQRILNAWLALFLCLLFAAHALLGSIKMAEPTFAGNFVWVVWIGVGVVVFHIIMSGVTTYDMWTDKERPASAKKKRHQWLKWITGGLILVCAAAHVILTQVPHTLPITSSVVQHVLMILLAGALGWHIFTSAKSLLKDLMPNVSKQARTYVRIGVVAFFTVVAIILIIALI